MRKSINLESAEQTRALLGDGDCHLRKVRNTLGVDIVVRKDFLHLNGTEPSVDRGFRTFMNMLDIVRQGRSIQTVDIDRILDSVQATQAAVNLPPGAVTGSRVWTSSHSPTSPHPMRSGSHRPPNRDQSTGSGDGPKRETDGWGATRPEEKDEPMAQKIRAITEGQQRYVDAIKDHDVVFAIGPAGCGKTYLAVALAVECLAHRMVNRLILVRPAVEAGEHLGFLPGDLREKVNPYLRPLYDSLHDMLSPNQVARFMERGVIEVAPLAFMRGRTLNNAFVILDEAQNTTPKQMKMFLTRLGNRSRAVITGDVTQVDLPEGDLSGLAHARDVLKDVQGVSFVHLEKSDIVRHPLVQRIVDAYEEREK